MHKTPQCHSGTDDHNNHNDKMATRQFHKQNLFHKQIEVHNSLVKTYSYIVHVCMYICSHPYCGQNENAHCESI